MSFLGVSRPTRIFFHLNVLCIFNLLLFLSLFKGVQYESTMLVLLLKFKIYLNVGVLPLSWSPRLSTIALNSLRADT